MYFQIEVVNEARTEFIMKIAEGSCQQWPGVWLSFKQQHQKKIIVKCHANP